MADSTEPQAPSHRPRSVLADYFKEPIEVVQSAIVSVHDALGIPWWATVVGAGICARALTLPLSLRAAAAGSNFTQARTAVNESTLRLLGDAGIAKCTPELAPHAKRLPMLTQQFARKPNNRLWLLAPLAQVPLLAIGTISMMTLDHPTLAAEGCLWFPDLTQSCLSFEGAGQVLSAQDVYMSNQESDALRSTIAPMGIYGVIIPTAFYLLWRDNLSNTMMTISHFYMRTFTKSAFEAGILQGRSRAQQGMLYNVKGAQILSLCIYPALLTVPTAGLLYLASSSATAWLVFRILPRLLQARGHHPGQVAAPDPTILTGEVTPSASTSDTLPTAHHQAALSASRTEAAPANHMQPITSSSSSIRGSTPLASAITTSNSTLPALQRSNDVEFLVDTSILSHASKRSRVALVAAQRAHQLQPKHARIVFAVAQLHRDLRAWKSALLAFNTCLALEPAENSAHRARVLANKSKCLVELRRPAEALQAATAAVELQPDEARHWMAKMDAHRVSGSISAAISDAKHIAKLDPDLGKDLPEVLEELQRPRSPKHPSHRG